jgi:hypothetical protein
MHVVHEDPVSARLRSLGFAVEHDWERAFPDYLFAPRALRRVERSPLLNAAYYVRDAWLNGPVTDAIVRSARGRLPGARAAVPDQRVRV